ncbi:MAG: hypothetical protein HY808_09565, partial [Nitrospirae bacterium]|nr:hypothetical protein [Nitrospirota bacterium]
MMKKIVLMGMIVLGMMGLFDEVCYADAFDNIRIEYLDGTEISATQTTTDNTITLYLRGYEGDTLKGDIIGNWTVEGGIGNCTPEQGISTLFNPTKPGVGTITVINGIYTDTVCPITVSPGAIHHIRIEHFNGTEVSATQTTTDDTITLYLRGYDADNNLIGDISGTWTVEGGIGTCTSGYGTTTIFNPTRPGAGTITVTCGVYTDTICPITVNLGVFDHTRIEYADYAEAGTIGITTDGSLNLYLRGYDADNNLIGDISGTWTVEGVIGNCSAGYGTTTIFDPTRPGAGTITATAGVRIDTTGLITVSLGVRDHIRIEYADYAEVGTIGTTTDGSLNLYLRGYDADNNLIGDISGTWTVEGGIGNCTPGYGTTTVFDPTRPGAGTITATDGIRTDTTGLITVSLGVRDYIRIE